jgi:agmatinase
MSPLLYDTQRHMRAWYNSTVYVLVVVEEHMSHYEYATPENFLGLEGDIASYEQAQVIVLPIPYEATVSFGQGARGGPRAIINASRQVELYDREFNCEYAFEYGVHTLPALAPHTAGPEQMVKSIEACAREHMATGKLLVGLGGEHSISSGFARAIKAIHGDFVLVQIDAHSDLRDSYEGSPYSHASVARRIADLGADILQFGIRSVCQEEMDYIRATPDTTRVWFNDDVHAGGHLPELIERIKGKKVFLTIDVDGLDPSIIPATGTPEPNGLSWTQTLEIVRTVSQNAEIVAFDCVELAPIAGMHSSDFITAKLIYKVINLIMAGRLD